LCDSGMCVCSTQYRKVGEKDEEFGCVKVVALGETCYEHTDCYKFNAVEQPMECFQNQCICRSGYGNDINDPEECVRTNSAASQFSIYVLALILMMAGVLLN
jgi:EB module